MNFSIPSANGDRNQMYMEAGGQLSSRNETLVSVVHANIFSISSQKNIYKLGCYVLFQIRFTRGFETTLLVEGSGNQGW